MASGAFEQFPASLAAGIADANIEKFPENPTMTENPNETTTTHPAESGNLKMQDIPSTSTTEPASTTHTSNHSRTLSEETLVDPSHPPGDHVPNNKEAKTFSHAIAEEHDPTQLSPSEQVQSHGLMAGKSVSDHDYQDPEKVLGTLTKEDFWLLVRRFNKQIQYVKTIEKAPPGDLDLIMSTKEVFSPDKLRANLERLYMTVIIGFLGLGKHIVRLRSWKEARRTACFCTAYFAAWTFDLIMPLIFSMLVALIIYPPSRHFLFPPMPMSLIDHKTGSLQKPASGSLGSKDSATGAPEKHRGEAVEQEAYNFASGFATVVVSTATGEHPVEDTTEEGDPKGQSGLDRSSIAAQAADTKAAAVGHPKDTKKDKTKEPVEAAIWGKARPAMRGIAEVCDVWERFENLLSPTPPFPKTPRYKLAGALATMTLIFAVVPSYIFVKATGFLLGAVFFGQPGIDRILNFLNTRYPNWMDAIDIRNTLLLHVPTNAQLTLTLLRIGETKNSPLPPPPRSNETPHESGPGTPIDEEDVPMDVSNAELDKAVNPDSLSPEEAEKKKTEEENSRKHPHRSKIMRFLKGTTRGGVETSLTADVVKATAGSKHARRRLGALPKTTEDAHTAVEFKARYEGTRGYAVLTSSATIPCISFSKHSNKNGELGEVKPVFSIPLKEIKGLRKVGGYGWKAKLVVGWAMDREVADGIEIEERSGRKYLITAMSGRDELFNRMVAVEGHIWECY